LKKQETKVRTTHFLRMH